MRSSWGTLEIICDISRVFGGSPLPNLLHILCWLALWILLSTNFPFSFSFRDTLACRISWSRASPSWMCLGISWRSCYAADSNSVGLPSNKLLSWVMQRLLVLGPGSGSACLKLNESSGDLVRKAESQAPPDFLSQNPCFQDAQVLVVTLILTRSTSVFSRSGPHLLFPQRRASSISLPAS